MSGRGLLVALVASAVLAGCTGGGEPRSGPQASTSVTLSSPPTTKAGRPQGSTPTPRPTQTPTPTQTEPPPPLPDGRAARCATAVVRGMTVPQRAGQLLMVGAEATSTAPSSDVATALDLGVGGVILTGRDPSSVDAVAALVDRLQQRARRATGGIGLEVSSDQEGGQVQALSGAGFSTMPTALVQGSWPAPRLRAQARGWGAELAAAGVTLDLAPVADVVPESVGSDNDPIGQYDRQFGDTAETVGPSVVAFVEGMRNAGVGTSVKHFPGLGRASGNTDVAAGVVDDVTTRTAKSLRPFANGIDAGAPYVMLSTATYTRIDPDRIAAFSPTIVTGMLRGDLGFEGVAITDDVGIATSVQDVPVGQRAVRFVAAGGDVVLTVEAAQAPTMRDALVRRAQEAPRFRALVRAAAVRVMIRKARIGLVDC